MDLISEELRRAHEDGDVVFFCGAGVSVPAGLMSFKDLVEAVLMDFLPKRKMCSLGSTGAMAWKAFDDDKYDEALDILENPREGGYEPKAVRKSVYDHLSKPKTKTLANHLVLTQLADLDTANGRLVTTNFDHLFERAYAKLRRLERISTKLTVHVAPALPPAKPETSHGLTHLHGKLGHSPDDKGLVLTMTDFGTAYLLEGWARRFVIELFRDYHIVFIGYRVEDPTMRYLVSALAAAREENRHFKEAYAFTPYDEDEGDPHTKEEAEQEWRLKGLTPIPYNIANKHYQLWQGLKDWADDHRQGILGRQQAVVRLGKLPPLGENDPATQKLSWALKDKIVAKFFADQTGPDRPHPGWISPFQEIGLLNQPIGQTWINDPIHVALVSYILSDHLNLCEATHHLGRWIASCLNHREVLDWALAQGGILHRDFRWEVQRFLKNSSDSIPLWSRKIWRVLSDSNYAHALSAKGSHGYPSLPHLGPDNLFAIRIFLECLRPIPVFKAKRSYFDKERDPKPDHPPDWCEIDIELVGIEHDHDIEQFRRSAKDWDGTLAVMAEDITTRLKEAMEWFQEFALASSDEDPTYIQYRSISPHDQNAHAHTWTQLIALARDSYDALVASGDESAATRLARRWQSLPYPVFQRLALYAATGGQDA